MQDLLSKSRDPSSLPNYSLVYTLSNSICVFSEKDSSTKSFVYGSFLFFENDIVYDTKHKRVPTESDIRRAVETWNLRVGDENTLAVKKSLTTTARYAEPEEAEVQSDEEEDEDEDEDVISVDEEEEVFEEE